MVDEDLCLKEFEKKIDVPDSYYGPRLSFPLTVEDANALLHAFRNEQVICNQLIFFFYICQVVVPQSSVRLNWYLMRYFTLLLHLITFSCYPGVIINVHGKMPCDLAVS